MGSFGGFVGALLHFDLDSRRRDECCLDDECEAFVWILGDTTDRPSQSTSEHMDWYVVIGTMVAWFSALLRLRLGFLWIRVALLVFCGRAAV